MPLTPTSVKYQIENTGINRFKPFLNLGNFPFQGNFAIVPAMLEDFIDLSTIRRVLVIKLRHHGDVLLTSPVFTILKNRAPHLEIDALVYKETAEMLTLHPAVSQVHTIDRNWKHQGLIAQGRAEWQLLSRLRARRYDLVVHLSEHPRGAWIKRLCGARYAVTRTLGQRGKFWRNSFSHTYPHPRGTFRHTVELHLDALRRIGVRPEMCERRLVLVPGVEAEQRVTNVLQEHGLRLGDYIHIHPTSRWLFKTWPADKVAQLIRGLTRRGQNLVLTAAPDAQEMAMIEGILAQAGVSVVNLAGKLSLKELAVLAGGARCFIGVDSAPMHIAAAMQTPVVVLFGPSGDKEWGPWQVPSKIITSDHTCRPCGNDGCGGGKISECLTSLPVETVLTAVEELLQTPRAT
jgi:heptosyltransferase-3